MATIYRMVLSGVQSGLVGIVLCLFLTPAFGEWVLISSIESPAGFDGEIDTYIDASDVKRGKQNGSARVLYDFHKPQRIDASSPYFHSMITTYLGDCRNRTTALIGNTYFRGRMGSGAIVDSDVIKPQFVTARFGTVLEKIIRSMCLPDDSASGAAITHQWTRVGREKDLAFLDQLNQSIEGPRIRAWMRWGDEGAMLNIAGLFEVNCANGTVRYLANQQYRAGIPGPITPAEDTPELGIGEEGPLHPVYYTLCAKVEKASGGRYITAEPRPSEATKPLPKPSERSDAWTLLTQDHYSRTSLDIGTVVPSNRELLGWLRFDFPKRPDDGPLFVYQQFDCANNRMRAIGLGGGPEPKRFSSAGNWQTLADQAGDIVKSVCSRFDDLVQRAQSHKRLLTTKERADKSTAAIADDERIAEALSKANEGLPRLRNPVTVGDYVVVNVHEETYGYPQGGTAFTKDKATGATLSINYVLSNDFKECRERLVVPSGSKLPANGRDKAKAAAKERCEAFVSREQPQPPVAPPQSHTKQTKENVNSTTALLHDRKASELSWKYKDWSVSSDDGFVRYLASGDTVYGHQFGLIKMAGNCNHDLLWISWSTYEKGMESFRGTDAAIQFRVGPALLRKEIPLLSVGEVTPLLTILAFTNVTADDELISQLEKGRKLEVTVTSPRELAAKIDIPEDTFSLDGFVASRLKAKEFCERLK